MERSTQTEDIQWPPLADGSQWKRPSMIERLGGVAGEHEQRRALSEVAEWEEPLPFRTRAIALLAALVAAATLMGVGFMSGLAL